MPLGLFIGGWDKKVAANKSGRVFPWGSWMLYLFVSDVNVACMQLGKTKEDRATLRG
jgi:hypothetical protein